MNAARQLEVASSLERDGVAVVRGVAGVETLAALRRVAERVRAGKRTLFATNGESLVDSYLWLTEPECQDVIVAGTLARLAATAMRSQVVRLFYDQVFSKTAGASAPTRWHQDLSHWPLRGQQVCSIWLAIDPVDKSSGALRYLAGSHRWGRLFRPTSHHETDGWECVEGEAVPSFDAPPYGASEVSFSLESGDCVIHNGATVHASHVNTIAQNNRLAYVTRWLGEDVRFHVRPFSSPFPLDVTVEEGALPDHPLFLAFRLV